MRTVIVDEGLRRQLVDSPTTNNSFEVGVLIGRQCDEGERERGRLFTGSRAFATPGEVINVDIPS